MFVNHDRKPLSTPTRNTIIISMDSFKDKIEKRSRKVNSWLNTGIKKPIDPKYFAESLINFDPIVKKDLKFIFDSENITADPKDCFGTFPSKNNLLGFNKTDFDMPYLGCMAGGDWECPLFFIIYFDGKK